jgi:hypothetical protein
MTYKRKENDMNTPISAHFSVEELCATSTGLQNKPNSQQLINLVYLAEHVLEPLRVAMNQPIPISSGFRSKEVNQMVGGVWNSQHAKGQAADLNIGGDLEKGKKWFEWIKVHCEFDQLIWEHNAAGVYWIHVSYVYPDFGKNRKQVIDNLLKK